MAVTAREAALTSGLALLLPDGGQTRLLRAALLGGDAGRGALAGIARVLDQAVDQACTETFASESPS